MSSNPLDKPPSVDPKQFVEDISEVGGVKNDLREFLDGNTGTVILDDSAIQDYVLKRARVTSDNKICTSSYESYEDVEKIIDSDINVLVPSGWESITWNTYHDKYSEDLENDEVDRRIHEIRTNCTEFDLKKINLRDGYRGIPNTDHRDRKIVQKAAENEITLVAYDSDLMRFDYDYLTTPGML